MLAGAVTVLAANPAVNLDQCRNGGLVASGTQTSIQCAGNGSGNSGWVNGNAGAANAHYAEGESISYRARLTNVQANDQVVLIMGYDVIHSGVHAIDYLTDKNRWQTPETTVALTPDKPCDTIAACVDPTDLQTAPIPVPTTNIHADPSKTVAGGCIGTATTGTGPLQPVTSFNAVPAAERNMEFFDATPAIVAPATSAITYVGPTPILTKTTGDQEQQIKVTFTANSSSPVLAWGGHIASRLDWGCSDSSLSASGISGSPYHMRIKDMTVNGIHVNLGNQDRSLSAAAVISVQPGITTDLSLDTVEVGGSVSDSATLAGATPDAGGTVTYTVYSDSTCATFYADAGTVNVTNGVVPDSDPITFNTAGDFYWQASYSGQGVNQPATSDCSTEHLVVTPANPTLPTTPNPSSGAIGATLNDSATVTGGFNPTGTVTFNLYGPDDAGCTTSIFSETVGLDAGGSASTTTGFTTVAAGTYEWTADYSGDGNNNSASSGCGAETVTIGKNQPGNSTAQDLLPNDTMTLTGATTDAGGSIDFYLFAPGDDCLLSNIANAFYTEEDVALVTNDHASTSNATEFATEEGTWSWLVIYSGDDNNEATTSDCVEQFSIDNDITP